MRIYSRPSDDNAARAEQLLSIRRALFIGAHPDDIEFYCGGLAHILLARGADVLFLVATCGGRGYAQPAKSRIEQLRSEHQLDSARILGGARVKLLDYPDKSLAQHVDPLADDLSSLVADEQPDAVFAWDPEHIYNPHPDHQALADASRAAIEHTGVDSFYYGTREPDLWLGYDHSVFNVRLQSLRAHRTETPWFYWPLQKRYTTKRSAQEGAKIGCKYAEVYRCDSRRKS